MSLNSAYNYYMTTLLLAFATVTQTFDLPPGLMSAVCWVESTHKINAIHKDDNGGDSLGVCQIKYETAKLMGFTGTAKQLREDPFINTYYAAKYIKKNLTRYKGDLRCTVAAYNAGKCRYDEQGHIKNKLYVAKVFNAWSVGR